MRGEYQVIYSPAALDDLRHIFNYIAHVLLAGQAAQNQIVHIRREIRKLELFPEKHEQVDWEPWVSMGTRKMSVDNYVVYYRVDNESKSVTIVRIFYGGRDVEHIIQDGIE